MPALTHGRVVNGFNAYPINYKVKPAPPNSISCKKTYVPNGTIIPLKYIRSKSCTSQKCRRVLKNNHSKLGLSKNISQRGIGDSIQKNILNRKKINQCNLQRKNNNKLNVKNKSNFYNCFKLC